MDFLKMTYFILCVWLFAYMSVCVALDFQVLKKPREAMYVKELELYLCVSHCVAKEQQVISPASTRSILNFIFI